MENRDFVHRTCEPIAFAIPNAATADIHVEIGTPMVGPIPCFLRRRAIDINLRELARCDGGDMMPLTRRMFVRILVTTRCRSPQHDGSRVDKTEFGRIVLPY